MKKVYLFFLCSTFLFSDIPNIFVIKKVDFRDNLFIYLKNESGKKLGIGKVFINDKDIEKLAKKGQVDEGGKLLQFNEKKEGIVRWYDIVPDEIESGSYGLIRIRSGEKGEVGDYINLKIIDKKGDEIVSKKIKILKLPDIEFSYYTFNPSLDKLTLYFDSSKNLKIEEVYIDGKKYNFEENEVKLKKRKKVIVNIDLGKCEREGKYLVVIVKTDKGINANLIRVIKPYFTIGMFRVLKSEVGKFRSGPPEEEWIRDCKNHFINLLAYIYEGGNTLNYAIKYNLLASICPHFESTGKAAKRYYLNPVIYNWAVCDEPEGWHCPPMRLIKIINMVRENEPLHPTSLIFCSKLAPFEYNFDDFPFVDYYPIPSSPIIGVGRMTEILKYAARPKPIGFIPQAFRGGISKKTGKSNMWRWSRFPAPEEERLMVYLAISNGAKAIHYFSYNIEPNEPIYGVGETKEKEAKILWDEIGKINAEINILSPWLWISDNIGLVSCKDEKVYLRSLICKDLIMVFVLNMDYIYKRDSFKINMKKDVKIKIKLPEWFDVSGVYRFNWKGVEKLNYRKRRNYLEVNIEKLGIEEILLIPRTEEVFLSILERKFDTLNVIKKLKGKIKIDGEFSDWKGIEPIVIDKNFANPVYYYSSKFKESKDLNVKVYLGYDEENLYIGAKVKDNIFIQREKGANIWKEDLFQFAFDIENNSYDEIGYKKDDFEFGLALTKEGPQCYCWHNVDRKKIGLRKDLEFNIKRKENLTIYEIKIPLKELKISKDKIFGFNFLVADTDTGIYWNTPKFLQFYPGIGGGKLPGCFTRFILWEE